jgi:hypothetical protein
MDKARPFLYKMTLVTALLVLADLVIGGWLARSYHHIAHGEQGRLNFVADSVTAPVLVLGSSRAAHQYVPPIIADSLHLACYNAGKDRQGLFYDLAVLKMIFSRYRPQQIILDLNPTDFGSAETGFDVLAVLLPYYEQHREIRSILNLRSPWERIKTLSTLYRYNSLPIQIVGRTVTDRESDTVSFGYLPKFEKLNPARLIPDPAAMFEAPPDSGILGAFTGILNLAREQGCRLTVVVSPLYFPLAHGSSTIRLAAAICNRQQVPFLDYSGSPLFTPDKPWLFYDAYHLNDSGARQFTRILCSALRAKTLP